MSTARKASPATPVVYARLQILPLFHATKTLLVLLDASFIQSVFLQSIYLYFHLFGGLKAESRERRPSRPTDPTL